MIDHYCDINDLYSFCSITKYTSTNYSPRLRPNVVYSALLVIIIYISDANGREFLASCFDIRAHATSILRDYGLKEPCIWIKRTLNTPPNPSTSAFASHDSHGSNESNEKFFRRNLRSWNHIVVEPQQHPFTQTLRAGDQEFRSTIRRLDAVWFGLDATT